MTRQDSVLQDKSQLSSTIPGLTAQQDPGQPSQPPLQNATAVVLPLNLNAILLSALTSLYSGFRLGEHHQKAHFPGVVIHSGDLVQVYPLLRPFQPPDTGQSAISVTHSPSSFLPFPDADEDEDRGQDEQAEVESHVLSHRYLDLGDHYKLPDRSSDNKTSSE